MRSVIFNTCCLALGVLLTGSMVLAATHQVDIQVTGVEDQLLENVRAYLSLQQQKNHPRLSEKRIERLHQKATEEIKRALEPFGYYQVEVQTTLQAIDATHWRAHYQIDLGPPLLIHELTVKLEGDGQNDPAFAELLNKFPLQQGQQLKHTDYEQAKRMLRNLAQERGYFEAQLTQHQLQIHQQKNQAFVILVLKTGARYRFGAVQFHQDTFDEALLQRFLTFKPGDFYQSSALLAFKNNLVDSDYFETVEVEVQRDAAYDDKRLPIEVTLTARKPTQFSVGIGYGTDTGVRGSLGWHRRYLNRYGHRFSAKTELSEIRKTATTRYEIPIGQLKEDYYAITAGYQDEQIRNIDSELYLVGFAKNHGRQFFDIPLREVIGIEYRDEKFAIGNCHHQAAINNCGHAKLLTPYINWSYLKADNRIYTTRGQKIQLELRGALDNLGSNASFFQSRLSTVFIRKLHDTGRIIARGEVGYSFVSLLAGDFHDLPPSIRFFAGGDRSVRGYDYKTLGPTNMEGDVIGGKNLLVGSLEYEQRILEQWSLAVFYDVGNAFNDFAQPLEHGAGFGVRWHSPVGLIRIDLAAALGEAGHYPLRLHITIGPDL
ncbi:MAG: autotransporter assembly complex family protein [Pseudomonadota bacterium]|nr:autotransporter assembly complex family protein [Pseudomonadota bacterium]